MTSPGSSPDSSPGSSPDSSPDALTTDAPVDAPAGADAPAHVKAVTPATDGAGPLLQRDYRAIIEGTPLTPQELIRKVLADFPSLSPGGLASFSFHEGEAPPLTLNSHLNILILAAGRCDVRIVHVDELSFTMRTLEGHPEAGRITMGAYWDASARLVFHIRSRARTADALHLLGYQVFGKALQKSVWFAFIERLAETCGGWIHGGIHEDTEEVADTMSDEAHMDTATFSPAKVAEAAALLRGEGN